LNNKSLEIIGHGRGAEVALDLVSPFIEEAKQDIIKQLVQLYKNPETRESGVSFISATAAYCALDDLESKLKITIRRKNLEFERTMPNV
jgi:hypothetical protein